MIFMAKYTNQGGRRENEDSLGVFTKDLNVCAVVADGLGSYGGGKAASQKAVDVVGSCFQNAQEISANMINDCVARIHSEVIAMQTDQCRMKTTIALLFSNGNQCIWAHVGDTRVYHFVDNVLKDMTLDHSLPQQAVLAGEITPQQIRHHKDRNKLLRALGQKGEVHADISAFEDVSVSNHAFLLCSDGFWDYVEEQEMERTLSESENPVEWMRKMSEILAGRVNGKNDNNTAIALWIKNN